MYIVLFPTYRSLKKNQNAPRPSEHPPVKRGKKCQCTVHKVHLVLHLRAGRIESWVLHANPIQSNHPLSLLSQVQFGRLLREQAAAQSMFMDGLQKSFVEPMESYTRGEYGELADNKKVWETAEEVYVAVSSIVR